MEKLIATVKRPLTLFSVSAWKAGYTAYLQDSLGFSYPIYFHFDGSKVTFYHKEKDFTYFKQTITPKLLANHALFTRLNASFLEQVAKLKKISIQEENLPEIWHGVGKVMSLYIFIVSDRFVEAMPEAGASRQASERILYEIDSLVEGLFVKKLVAQGYNPEFAKVLTQDDFEAIQTHMLNEESLYERLKEYIVEGDALEIGVSFSDFCVNQGFLFEEQVPDNLKILKGNSAFAGVAKGRVVQVVESGDIEKVQNGDILVSYMTNATHLPAMARAGAVVTDEGGITCHAAIAARELKIPCIVGTKYATQVFKDGDVVEVDANNGIVTLLLKSASVT